MKKKTPSKPKTCCGTFLAVVSFILNGAIFLAGLVLLGVGVWVMLKSDSFLVLLETVGKPFLLDKLVLFSQIFIGVGAALMVFAIVGSFGAHYENHWVLLVVFFGLVILLVFELVGAIMLFMFPGGVGEILSQNQNRITKTIQDKYGRNENLTSQWNTTMDELKCCGFKEYTDFEGSQFVNENGIFPSACCRNSGRPCDENAAYHSKVEGCFDKLMETTVEYSVIIACMALLTAAIEIAAIVVVMAFFCKAGRMKLLIKSCRQCLRTCDYCKMGCECLHCLTKMKK